MLLCLTTLLTFIPFININDDSSQSNGNPIPSQFDYGEDHDPRVTEYTYAIPWDPSWDCIYLYIAAHTVVWIWGWGICP